MSVSDVDGNNRNKVIINLPANTTRDYAGLSKNDEKLKDELMKLIIDTKDEAIELKINGEQYRKIGIHDEWRQVDFNSDKAAYFSYQEKAAKEFIFRFNKCGILSDQVGMGKTIEAGMIISELAYRKELGSLLILVPNENMAEKWENELARKFGFRNYYKDLAFRSGKSEKVVPYKELPRVASIKSVDDLYSIIYNAVDELKFTEGKRLADKIVRAGKEAFHSVVDEKYENDIKLEIRKALEAHKQVDGKEFKMRILNSVYAPLIKKVVCAVAEKLGFGKEVNVSDYNVADAGTHYRIVDMLLDVPIANISVANGIYDRLVDEEMIANSIVGEFSVITAQKGKRFIDELNDTARKNTSDVDRVKNIETFRKIAKQIKRQYAILIVSKVVNHEGNEQFNLLNHCINEEYESDSLKYCSVSVVAEKGYRVIDMLIDMSYKTLIVDEAHDYIKVSHKLRMRDDIASSNDYEYRQREAKEFSDIDLSAAGRNYFVFPLYNDYYFVERDCMYLKIKALSDRSYRKIFMTATPIKSDMIDFYLLYLLADNGDTGISGRIRSLLNEEEISKVAALVVGTMDNNRKRALNYCTYEDIAIKYVYLYYKKNTEKYASGKFNDKIRMIVDKTISENYIDEETVKDICVNNVRVQFQDTFTIKNYETGERKEVDSISDLVSSDEGIEQWQNMYSQIGIRSTRHQTFRLDEERLNLLKSVQRGKYRNLPVWSRRNGTIVYIHKKDNYFDLVVKEKIDARGKARALIIYDEEAELRRQSIDEPKSKEIAALRRSFDEEVEEINAEDYTEKLKENKIAEAKKRFDKKVEQVEYGYKPKETAMTVYNYINSQLTGKLDVADYYSTDVDYDEFKLHMIVKMMTDGLEIRNDISQERTKSIVGKVLLFTDQKTQGKVLSWLRNECDPQGKSMTEAEKDAYVFRYKHVPLWYYNSLRADEEDKWVITTDIKALKEKRGNYLIVVEPNKYEEGVDLQASDTLINFDIKFCPLKMEQRIGRIDRVKLCDEQPQLNIISFTPLNDMSGFMVDFLANELKMFSCWRGDTTGIVSMPLGDKPNSATFESAILAINDAYVALYDYDGARFVSACKRIKELGKNFSNDNFKGVNTVLENENAIIDDICYLKESADFVNEITSNSESSGEDGENGFVVFDHLGALAEEKAVQDGLISEESISGHVNDLKKLKKAVREYYEFNIGVTENGMRAIENASKTVTEGGKIDTDYSAVKNRYESLKKKNNALCAEYEKFKTSKLETVAETSLGIRKADVDKSLRPILGRYKACLSTYLDVLIDLFDRFCSDVKDKAEKMTRFISYLTIEEFKVMANDYE